MDDRPHEGASRLVQRLVVGDGCHGFGHRHRLSGQHAFVALELVDLQQAEVGWHEGADAKRYHVAGHEVSHRNPGHPSVPEGLGLVSDLAAEGGHRHFGPILVEEAQTDAEGDDHRNDHRVRAATGQPGHQRRPEQKNQDRVPDLAEEDGAGTHLMRTERVRPELS